MLSSGAAQLGQIGDKEVTTSVEVRLIVPNRKDQTIMPISNSMIILSGRRKS